MHSLFFFSYGVIPIKAANSKAFSEDHKKCGLNYTIDVTKFLTAKVVQHHMTHDKMKYGYRKPDEFGNNLKQSNIHSVLNNLHEGNVLFVDCCLIYQNSNLSTQFCHELCVDACLACKKNLVASQAYRVII